MSGVNPKDEIGDTKPDLSLIPPSALIEMARGFADGARKYGPFNWRGKPVRARVYTAAAMRHILLWADREENASDSNVHHLGHAMDCLAILVDAQRGGDMHDDRPPPGKAAEMIAEYTRKEPGFGTPYVLAAVAVEGVSAGELLAVAPARVLITPPPAHDEAMRSIVNAPADGERDGSASNWRGQHTTVPADFPQLKRLEGYWIDAPAEPVGSDPQGSIYRHGGFRRGYPTHTPPEVREPSDTPEDDPQGTASD